MNNFNSSLITNGGNQNPLLSQVNNNNNNLNTINTNNTVIGNNTQVKVMKDSTTNIMSYNKATQILTSTVNGKTDTTLIFTASKDSTIARNGLTQIKDTVELGGTLIKPTTTN
jgi:hypothetical protein